ncbi:MAG: hypothetical protein IKO55_00710, partial [Kiritimatiellae bacterium]|nr:hypothetical protein [Kiritimatiellia bacterium]
MKLNLDEMKEVAKTLPIGYYLGMKVPVDIDSSDRAYCDVIKREIHVGIGLLQQAADNIDAADAASWDREKLLRCLLYHEVAHLLLTPEWANGGDLRLELTENDGSKTPLTPTLCHKIINTFEDERIEQILANEFYGVDFKRFVRLVNKKNGPGDGSVLSRFYRSVRLRQTTPDISAAVDDAIESLMNVNASTDIGEHIYLNALQSLLDKIVEHSKQEEKQKQNEQEEQKGQNEQEEQEEQKGQNEQEEQEEQKGQNE